MCGRVQTEFQAAGADDAALQMLERVRAHLNPLLLVPGNVLST